MNDRELADFRQMLRNLSHSGFEDPDEIDSQIDLLMEVDKGGRRKMAREMLEILPEPEHEVVLDFRALKRVWERDLQEVETELLDRNISEDRVRDEIRRALLQKREEALEVVRSRLVVDPEPGPATNKVVKDPVSKMKRNTSINHLDEEDFSLRRAKEQLANDVLGYHD
ncbi:MAG: hypothetical protein ABEH81_01285 [Halopenitus sp.]